MGLMGGLLGLLSGGGLGWLLVHLVQTPDLDLRPALPALPAGLILLSTVGLALLAGLLASRAAMRARGACGQLRLRSTS